MVKKAMQEKSTPRNGKKEDRFEWLARMMKEGYEDVETKLRKEIKETAKNTENVLRAEVRNVEENLQYRIAQSAGGIYRRNDTFIEPKIQDHERRIKKLEHAQTASV